MTIRIGIRTQSRIYRSTGWMMVERKAHEKTRRESKKKNDFFVGWESEREVRERERVEEGEMRLTAGSSMRTPSGAFMNNAIVKIMIFVFLVFVCVFVCFVCLVCCFPTLPFTLSFFFLPSLPSDEDWMTDGRGRRLLLSSQGCWK